MDGCPREYTRELPSTASNSTSRTKGDQWSRCGACTPVFLLRPHTLRGATIRETNRRFRRIAWVTKRSCRGVCPGDEHSRIIAGRTVPAARRRAYDTKPLPSDRRLSIDEAFLVP